MIAARRLTLTGLVSLCAVGGALLLCDAPALAVAPEAPELTVESPVPATTATLHGVLNPGAVAPGEPGTYEFLYREGSAGCGGGRRAPEPPGMALGLEREAVTEELSGLAPNTEYTVCLLARNAAEETALSAPVTFTTLRVPPTIEGESSSEEDSSSVRLTAKVNPNHDPSSYFFEYGTSAGYGTKTAAASVGAGTEGVAVFVTLSELQPETEYHFRVVAENASEETALGGDETFRTVAPPPPAQVGLPDDRGYELVSPYMENANVFTPRNDSLLFQVAPDGSAVAYVGEPSAGGDGSTVLEHEGGNEYLARRAAGGGWTAGVIQTAGGSYLGFSGDLSVGFLRSRGEALIPGEGGGLYSREESGGGYSFLAPSATFPAWYAGSTVDGGHVLIESGGDGLYDSVGGRLVPVSVLPDGEAAPEAKFGAPPAYIASRPWEGEDNYFDQGKGRDLDGAISEDGSRIFWSTVEVTGEEIYSSGGFGPNGFKRTYGSKALYVREDDASPDARTVQVDASQGGPGASGGGRFWTASGDGSRVYFTDESRLTADSTAAPGEPDLYVFDVETEKLTDLTVAANGTGDLSAATGTGDLSAATGTGDLSAGSREVTGVVLTSASAFAVGEQIEGPGIPAGTTITAVDLGLGTLELSAAATASGTDKALSAGSREVTGVVLTSASAFAVGEQIEGPGIPAGTTITAVGAGTLELSAAATAAGTDEALSAGSEEVTSVVTAGGRFVVGQAISGAGIRAGSTITAVTEDTLTLSEPADASGTGVALSTDLADVQGVLGAGESTEGGAYVYFVATGVLASGAGQGALNLYVIHEGEPPKFITALSPYDGELGFYLADGAGDWRPELGKRTAEVTPDGRNLAFMLGGSSGEGGAEGGAKGTEFFVYDAVAGSLSCASCSVSNGYVLVPVSYHAQYQPRFISDDGSQVFFAEVLSVNGSPQSGRSWVYEWERDGSGSCELAGGCVYLLAHGPNQAQGEGPNNIPLLGASASGDDVFFVSREQLVPQDGDEDTHVYDARVGAPQPLAPLACTSSGCQGAPLPAPVFATPASVTFAGVGNFPAPSPAAVKPKPKSKTVKCGKGYAKKRGKCVKRRKARGARAKRVARSQGRGGR
jgi:hypothetical protein